MESCDSSPNYMKATSSSDAKKGNSQGGCECDDDTMSVGSSTCGSAVNGLSAIKPESGNKYRTKSKRMQKNFMNVRSFRRRAWSRTVQSSHEVSDASPNYLKATGRSGGTKSNFLASSHGSDSSVDHNNVTSSLSKSAVPSQKSLLTRTSSIKSVRILLKRTSFKPKRSSLKYSEVPEEVHVDRATYSSTLKDSKFPDPVALLPKGKNLEETPVIIKVCRYHHCSLHGHCNSTHDPVAPPKRFFYRRRQPIKKQRSIKPENGFRATVKHPADKKKGLQKSHMFPNVQTAMHESGSEDLASSSSVNNENDVESGMEVYGKPNPQLSEGVPEGMNESDLAEIAFGETSYPEENYLESLNQVRYYHSQEQVNPENCLRCSCKKAERKKSIKKEKGLPSHHVTAYNFRNGHNSQTSQDKANDRSDTHAPVPYIKHDGQFHTLNKDTVVSRSREVKIEASNKKDPSTLENIDNTSDCNSVISSVSDCHTSKGSNSPLEQELAAGYPPVGDSEASEAVQVEHSESPQFSKKRHISMWRMIHQHMASGLTTESVNKPLHGDDDENKEGRLTSLLAISGSPVSSQNLSGSGLGAEDNDSEIHDIEIRKMFAIKLVREAIEKILLPEIPDQTSDNLSTTSDDVPEHEILEKNQGKASAQESHGESQLNKGEGSATSGPSEVDTTTSNSSAPETVKDEKKVGLKSKNKAPKHWSNLKKWILLQRFIKELEKVRKLNLRKPRHLLLKPEPEAEKVSLRPQSLEERKRAEEWMLDYALRQAVNQLAPTQKQKVALLVKAFETVVPPQEDSQMQFRIPRTKDHGRDLISSSGVDELFSEGKGRGKDAVQTGNLKSDNGADGSIISDQKHGEKNSLDKEQIVAGNFELISDDGGSSRESLEVDGLNRKAQSLEGINGVSGDLSLAHPSSSDKTAPPHVESQLIPQDISNSESSNVAFKQSNGKMKPGAPDSDPEQKMTLGDGIDRDAATGAKGNQVNMKSDYDEPKTAENREGNIKLKRQNYMEMWHMIYQHVVTDIATKVGSQLLDETDDDEVEDSNQPTEINNGDPCLQPKDEQGEDEKHVSIHKRSVFTKNDALKLVQDAVDEILLPEIQDDLSDAQSITSNLIPDDDFSEGNQGEVGDGNTPKSTELDEESEKECIIREGAVLMSREAEESTVENVTDQETRGELPIRKTLELPMSKNWRKLKKLILLKRSIKALEKARKLNLKPHIPLPIMPNREPEKVDLRHEMMEERKRAEQWMLDYAVQHIVTKLTPARKRRVAMLVEAFEAVVPLPEM